MTCLDDTEIAAVQAAEPARPSRIAILVSVHHHAGRGLKQEVESMLKHNPLKAFRMVELLRLVRRNTTRGEVSSILAKLRQAGLIVEGVAAGTEVKSRKLVKTYQWRLPSHGR